jgi:hypothetical protein
MKLLVGGFSVVVLVAAGCARTQQVSESGRSETRNFSVQRDGSTVTVTSKAAVSWAAIIDATTGGVIREVRLPADGPNALGRSDSYGGFFNLRTSARPTVPDEAGKMRSRAANGTPWQDKNGEARIDKVTVAGEDIIVEASGHYAGWTMVAKGQKIASYKYKYTFSGDGITCEAAVDWAYPNNFAMNKLEVDYYLAPKTIRYPWLVSSAGGALKPLLITPEGGMTYSKQGLTTPDRYVVELASGYRVEIRTTEVPAQFTKTDTYVSILPWIASNGVRLGIESDATHAGQPFPKGPVTIKHRVSFAKVEKPAPVLVVSSPAAGAEMKPGQALQLTATAQDGAQAVDPARIEWQVLANGRRPIGAVRGGTATFTVPADEKAVHGYALARVTTDDGRIAETYVNLGTMPVKEEPKATPAASTEARQQPTASAQ